MLQEDSLSAQHQAFIALFHCHLKKPTLLHSLLSRVSLEGWSQVLGLYLALKYL